MEEGAVEEDAEVAEVAEGLEEVVDGSFEEAEGVVDAGTTKEFVVRGDEKFDEGAVEGVDESVEEVLGALEDVAEGVGTGCLEGKLFDGRFAGFAAVGGPSWSVLKATGNNGERD